MQREKLKNSIKNSSSCYALLSFTHYSSLVTRYFLLFTCLLLLITLSGCGYTVHTRADLPFDTIAVGIIENRTREPKLQDMFSKVLAETFAQYAFRVNPSARYRLEGAITKFELRPLAEHDLVATQYKVVIKANFRLIDTVNGAVTPIVAESPFITYFSSTGRLETVLAQKEVSIVSAMQNLAQEVARRIIYR